MNFNAFIAIYEDGEPVIIQGEPSEQIEEELELGICSVLKISSKTPISVAELRSNGMFVKMQADKGRCQK